VGHWLLVVASLGGRYQSLSPSQLSTTPSHRQADPGSAELLMLMAGASWHSRSFLSLLEVMLVLVLVLVLGAECGRWALTLEDTRKAAACLGCLLPKQRPAYVHMLNLSTSLFHSMVLARKRPVGW
jgi:hypothetical protein